MTWRGSQCVRPWDTEVKVRRKKLREEGDRGDKAGRWRCSLTLALHS